MSHTYVHKEIEERWILAWEKDAVHTVDINRAKHPYYNLMMFPYPSAEGLHVGNMFAFVGSDIHGRFMRARGYDVFEPMGFDAFGMHSENFAIKNGGHPWSMTPKNIEYFRENQLKRVGNMFDWNHQVDSTDSSYYRWTQWIFLELFKAGLAYQKMANVNWCPSCNTVLANEQAAGGTCERCNSLVVDREMKQWFFRITSYADRLLSGLDTIDWSDTTKQAQRNWIGRSTGAEIEFAVAGRDEKITVFTTRPETIFGVTFLGISKNHPLADARFEGQPNDIFTALENAARREDTPFGIETGMQALHPTSGKRIPIWIVDYVVSDYGSGAVMGVPAHDTRDYDFAIKYDLPIVSVITRTATTETAKVSDRSITGEGPLPFTGHGILENCEAFSGRDSREAVTGIIDYIETRELGRRATKYHLRDWCVSRQRYWGTPIPIIHCDACGVVPVPADDLPVALPFIENFHPDGSGLAPLARDESFTSTTCPACGNAARRETDVCDNFLDSSWYFLRYPSSGDSKRAFDEEQVNRWLPVDMYIGGNEHAVLHLMYTRFVTMALFDAGHIAFEEPFKRFRANGIIVKDGAKMSKSKGNIINPDTYIEKYGADVFRTYLMFFGNYTEGGNFRDRNISGIERFLDKIFRFENERTVADIPMDPELQSHVYRRVRKITQNIETLRYNTAIASCMELYQHVASVDPCPLEGYITLLKLLAPFAPFLMQELWRRSGKSGYISQAPWPEYDETLIDDREFELVIQINGRVRDKCMTSSDIDESTAVELAKSRTRVGDYLADKTIIKTVFVPGRLLNLVVKQDGRGGGCQTSGR